MWKIRLIVITGLSKLVRASTPAAVALERLAQDRRIELVLVHDVQPANVRKTIQVAWEEALEPLKRGDLQGLVWLREDVIVDDFLLADRLEELGAEAGLYVQHNPRGEVVFMFTNTSGGHSPIDFDQFLASVPHHPLRAVALSQWLPGMHRAETLPMGLKPQPQELLVVSATRQSPDNFYSGTALGQSITRLRQAGVQLKARIFCNNQRPLGDVYNSAMEPAWADHMVLFVHDDVYIDDWQIAHRLHDALQVYDVVGVAGNRQRLPGQPAWHFPQHVGHWAPAAHLLGCVGHDTTQRKGPGRKVRVVSHYGTSRGTAQVLDGVLIAAQGRVLLQSGLRFDPRFGFHFYDLDLSRSAIERGLRLGVWPIAITHRSIGGYNNTAWEKTYLDYLAKWGEEAPKPRPHVTP